MGNYPAYDEEGDPQCEDHGQLEPCSRCEYIDEQTGVCDEDNLHSDECIRRMEVQEALEMGEYDSATRWERILTIEVRKLQTEIKNANEEKRNLLVQRDAALQLVRSLQNSLRNTSRYENP